MYVEIVVAKSAGIASLTPSVIFVRSPSILATKFGLSITLRPSIFTKAESFPFKSACLRLVTAAGTIAVPALCETYLTLSNSRKPL